ncbi:PMS2 [Sergentomyia squamirostris]
MDSQENTPIESVVEGTTEISKEIKAIDKISVHKICSGQVILGLGSAVKELVENSLDAKATLIEVKLKDYGSESIEVTDNGIGVEEENFKGLTAKYHTSKIRDFTDLEQVATFGFRGEALSSLCALSDMVITTKHKSASCGTRLVFNLRGDIAEKMHCAHPVGTTVQLKNLFGSLPVRKAEFSRNIRKEFSKMCLILQSYCLSAVGVRIICTNIKPNGKKTPVFHTDGGKDILDNIRNIFGPRQVADLVKIKPPLERDDQFSQETFQELDLDEVSREDLEKLNVLQFTITGWISTCAHDAGRSSRDRQFIFINSRPCELKKISQVINDVYRKYNIYQFPFVFLDIRMDNSKVDVNVTPDKRQLFVASENILLLALRISLLRTFNECAATYKIEKPEKSIKMFTSFTVEKKQPEIQAEETEILPSSQEKFSEKLSQWKATGNTEDGDWRGKNVKRKLEDDEINSRKVKMQKIQKILNESPEKSPIRSRFSCGSTPRREITFETTPSVPSAKVKASPEKPTPSEEKIHSSCSR